jgi:predicted nucleic acid-binding protein
MVEAEVIEGTLDSRDLIRSRRAFRSFNIIHATEADGATAIEWLARVHLSLGVGFHDCLIASTALRLNLTVVTTNDRDFRLFKGLRVIRPY